MTICIIAGKGDLPKMAIKKLQSEKKNFKLALIADQDYDDEIKNYPHQIFPFGHIGAFLQFTKEAKISKIVMVGAVKKPSLAALKFDKMGMILLSKILKQKLFGDDNLLSTIIDFFEKKGLKIIGIDEIIDDLLIEKGILGKIKADKNYLKDIEIGKNALQTTSDLDLGQSIIIQQKLIVAIEALEGTDELIKRSKKIQLEGGSKPILVKMKKKNQNKKVDLPAFGIKTVKNLVQNNFAGAALEAGSCLIINKKEVTEYANKNGIFILGVKN
ncbi:UDP-2,3-diacylglucosamine diphosphatase LpxI [Rickettsiales bacterium]|nr:UDP-2,3-diacylglucosamine diphosphatase LpxI [Rickettsiales bacterium]MDB2550442.1 UDP-2,3-diacylglucosamine diphosphatase LpxI [Rickettsiales bacterium]